MVETTRVDVIILCGGLGTRLSPVVADRPKPMAEIGREPFLEILVSHVTRYGFQMNGDSFCPLNLLSFLNFHEQRGGVGSVAVVPAGQRTDGGFIYLTTEPLYYDDIGTPERLERCRRAWAG